MQQPSSSYLSPLEESLYVDADLFHIEDDDNLRYRIPSENDVLQERAAAAAATGGGMGDRKSVV